MSTELKIKAESLAQEARIIRREEKQAKHEGNYSLCQSLNRHRIDIVRKAARSTHLARAFLKGTPYKHVEQTCRTEPHWKEILRLIIKYGPQDLQTHTPEERKAALMQWAYAENTSTKK